jgi:hypothetical protein
VAKNMVGFEAEFFAYQKKQKGGASLPVVPEKFGLPHDDFPYLVEVRGEPGSTPAETYANFMKAYLEVLDKMDRLGFVQGPSAYATIPENLYLEALRRMTKKSFTEHNIYDLASISIDDRVYENGNLVGRLVSAGFHIHFSSDEAVVVRKSEDNYIPIGDGKYVVYGKKDASLTSKVSLITKPVVYHIVKTLDETVFDSYSLKGGPVLKYRQQGFFELKPWGFEYRSLPFTKKVNEGSFDIAKFCFELLNGLQTY